MRSRGAWIAALLLGLAACGDEPDFRGRVRGGWLAAEYGVHDLAAPESHAALERMRALGIDWLAVGPEVHLADHTRPEIHLGEDDTELRRLIRRARVAGFRIFLLPRLEAPSFFSKPFPWRGDIAMPSAGDWETFHRNYEAMILHYARLAQQEGVDLLAIGLEYRQSSLHFPDRWRRIAGAVRTVFEGRLTYSANWWGEYDRITWWDAVDLIGIGAYFGIARHESADLRHLLVHWTPTKRRLAALSRRYDRPILFTEVGFTTFADAGMRPWRWQEDLDRPLDPRHQAACWEALLRTFAPEPWFEGLFVWRFYAGDDGIPPWEYTPEGKPAEAVLRDWFHR
jgi:hypothetical protein